MSERAYLSALGSATAILKEEKATTNARGEQHLWDHVDFDRVGTHSMKRTAVALFKDNVKSISSCDRQPHGNQPESIG